MATMPTSFNPSDYEFLLKSVIEGNLVSKAESLKRFNTLVVTDKKQFAIYAKRVVLAIQELLTEPKEDINLLASTLALEIINLNPREIQYYIRTKLLKNMVKNLGDGKPQIRKTSHYCLLAYVKTYKTFDEVIQIYIHYGIHSESWQLRQKSINSFQSILIMEMKYLNWSSAEFRKVVQELLNRTNDENQYVQKASEQCLLSICKYEELRNFSKKLPNAFYNSLKQFCQYMHAQGFLPEIKLYVAEIQHSITKNYSMVSVQNEQKPIEKGYSLNQLQKKSPPEPNNPQSIVAKQALINRIEQIRKKAQTPVKDNPEDKQPKIEPPVDKPPSKLKKAESVTTVPRRAERQKQVALPSIRKSIHITEKRPDSEIKISLKGQKSEVALGRKLIDDLRNEKDWKVRLEAIEELQNKFISNKDSAELENLAKTFLHILIKLLADPNFKVALIALKIIEEILDLDSINYSSLVPQLVQKISDGKVALRQNISKLIRKEYIRTSNKAWINELLAQLRKSPAPNSNIKEEILNILSKMTIQATENSENSKRIDAISSSIENIVQAICPLMDDLKTKIKIKTLDLLILLSMKTQRIDSVKSILAARLNQVYYEMYTEKIAKELKAHGLYQDPDRGTTAGDRRNRNERSMLLTNRRYGKSPGNTTSTSLKKYSSVEEHNTTARTASFIETNKNNKKTENQKQFDDISIGDGGKEDQSPKKSIIKSYRKKTFDYKSTQYSAFSAGPALPPFNDPDKELKLIMAEIKSDEWQTCSEALTKLRRIIENHSELLTHSILRVITPQVMRLVESLRSNLSKNAVIALHDLSNQVKKMLDTELDSIFTKLLKKTLDTNSFISEEVRRALISICSNCNENRVVSLLINSHTSRAVPIKISIASVLENIAFLPKFFERELERIVGILVDFLSEGSLEIRQKSKALLSNILCSERGSQVISLIPPEHLNKLKLRQLKKQPSEPANKDASMMEGGQTGQEQFNTIKKKKKQKITVFPEEFDQLDSLLEQCQSSDWKARQRNMSIIYETVIETYPKQLCQHRLSGRIMDVLSKQIGDPNVKVASNALRILQSLPGRTPELIEHNLSVLTNEIFNCFGSHKPEIKKLSEELFDLIADNVEKWMLIQHMCNGALYGLQKSRPVILQRLSEIIPSVYAKGNKKTLINKNLYPLINKLAEENKTENLEGLTRLMNTCNQNTGGQFVNNLKPKAIQLWNSLQSD